MHPFADYHMHSKYSDGRATIEEMAEAGRKKGLEKIAITDHGPKNIGVGVESAESLLKVKEEIAELNQRLPDIQVLSGVEANVVDLAGAIDVPKKIYKELDLLLVGLHPYVWPNDLNTAWEFVTMNMLQNISSSAYEKCKTTNTKTLIEALYKHDVDIVTHPGLGLPVDLEELARACVATNTAYEINTGHAYQKAEEIAQVASLGVDFVVNSDAHFTESVGELEAGLALLKQAKVLPERIINVRRA